MDIYTVSFFGHREINGYYGIIREHLRNIITYLIKNKEYVEFLIGRDGEFDILASSVITKMKERYDYGNTAHILVLPYERAEFRNNEKSFLEYYDEVEICEESCNKHFKAAIGIRNRSMADRSDLVVCFAVHNYGGAYSAMKYAVGKNISTVNIADDNSYKNFIGKFAKAENIF